MSNCVLTSHYLETATTWRQPLPGDVTTWRRHSILRRQLLEPPLRVLREEALGSLSLFCFVPLLSRRGQQELPCGRPLATVLSQTSALGLDPRSFSWYPGPGISPSRLLALLPSTVLQVPEETRRRCKSWAEVPGRPSLGGPPGVHADTCCAFFPWRLRRSNRRTRGKGAGET